MRSPSHLARRVRRAPLDLLARLLADRLLRVSVCHGPRNRLAVEPTANVQNTLFNTRSGRITVGARTIFGHGCMILTGVHDFEEGQRSSLAGRREVPTEGHDIVIGTSCWIASGAIVLGKVTIGDGAIVGAGAVVTADVPPGVFVAGVPARVAGAT